MVRDPDDSARGVGRDRRACRSSGGDGEYRQKDLVRDPGLHRSMFANGLSTIISGFFGSTPNTTYGENIGVMAITRVYSTGYRRRGDFAILLSCVGKLAAAIQIIRYP